MNKHLVPMLMILGLLAACAPAPSAPAAAEPGAAAPAAPEPAAAPGTEFTTGLKAAMVTPQDRGDQGVIDAFVTGFLSAGADFQYAETKIIVAKDPATYTSTVQQVAEAGYDVIIVLFPPFIDATKAVAPNFPDAKFTIMDAALGEEISNVQELFFLENESSYLAGIAAGMMTETNKVGFIGALPQDVIDRYAVGFYEGAHAANPDVEVCWTYANALEDPAKGKELALAYYNQGMDIIHAATAGTQLGVIEGSKEAQKFLISADTDIIPLNPEFGLFSTGPRFDQAAYLTLRSAADGSWVNGHQVYGLATDMVGHTPFNQALVPLEVQQAILKAKADIINGTVTVDDDRKLPDLENCS